MPSSCSFTHAQDALNVGKKVHESLSLALPSCLYLIFKF